MKAIEEIESGSDTSRVLELPRHVEEAPEVPLEGTFHPLGFPMVLRTNLPEVLELAYEQWGKYEKLQDTEPIRVFMYVTEGGSPECPPLPKHRFFWPLRLTVADADNYVIYEMEQNRTHLAVTSGAMRHKLYIGYFFLGAAPGVHISTRYTTPVHAACVALDGRAVLLAGESGAGKSTLSYACARAGWTYVSDDGSYLLNCGRNRMVIGNCHHLRFRPTAAELFPELQGQHITPRMFGKPSIELRTELFPNMACAQTAHVDFMVFLNRNSGGPAELVPYPKDVARQAMRRGLYGSPKSLATQYPVIERMLTADVLELRYTNLDWAVDRLQRLVREGR